MSMLRYERPRSESSLNQVLGSLVSILGGLPVLWLLWLVVTLCLSKQGLHGSLAWGLVLLPVGALLLLFGLVTLPAAARLGGPGRAGWALTLLLLSLVAEAGCGVWASRAADWVSPAALRTAVPGQSDQAVWLAAESVGFIDSNLQVDVFLRTDPWYGPAQDEWLGTFTSPFETAAGYSASFEFEWAGPDTLRIYTPNPSRYHPTERARWLVAVVVPGQKLALRPGALAQRQLAPNPAAFSPSSSPY